MPDSCIKCNAPANGLRLKRNLSWHHPLLYILVFGAALFYIILALVLSKRATINFGLCPEHFRRRRRLMSIGGILLSLGVIVPIIAFTSDYPMIGVLGILLFLFAIGWMIVAAKVVHVKKIDDNYVWLKGINDQYMMQFPLLPGHP